MKGAADHRKMLVIGLQWPEPQATAAGQRMCQLLQGFCNAGYQITFASAAAGEHDCTPLKAMGIETRSIKLNHSSFDQWLQRSGFDLVLFDRFITEEQFSWRVREQLPDCIFLLDTEDLHSLRHSRETAVRANRDWVVSDWLESPGLYRELASILRCDLSLIISRFEQNLLRTHLPFLKGKLHYLPFQFSPEGLSPGPPFSGRRGFVFVGNGKHRPNLDAIVQLKSEIWPRLRQLLPDTRLDIYGAYLPEAIQKLNAPEAGFEVKGWAPDLEPVCAKSRLQLAPLRFGAGVKGKILNALCYGLPTLSSPIGWEGVYEGEASVDFLAETPEAFARKAALLYTNEAAWKRSLQEQLRASAPHFTPSMEALLEAVQNPGQPWNSLSKEQRVLQNMLRHQAFDRSKYLSRWIEAKENRSV